LMSCLVVSSVAGCVVVVAAIDCSLLLKRYLR
jgi:hypothetical protein